MRLNIGAPALSVGLLWLLAAVPGDCQAFACKKLNGAKPDELMRYLQRRPAPPPQDCTLFAIEQLGFARYEPAVPLLVKYLDYPRPPDPGWWHSHAQDVGYLYPAANALFGVGKESIPALLRVTASPDSSDLLRMNAGDTIFALYSRDHIEEGIAVMMRASRQESDPYSRAHLDDAARYWASRCPPEHQNACVAALQ